MTLANGKINGGARPNSGPDKGAKYRTKAELSMVEALAAARKYDKDIRKAQGLPPPATKQTSPRMTQAPRNAVDVSVATAAPAIEQTMPVAPGVNGPIIPPLVSDAPRPAPAAFVFVDEPPAVDPAYEAWLKRPVFKPGTSPLEFLCEVMHCDQAPLDLRVRCAQIAAPLIHAKPAEIGKKAAKDEAAKKSSGAGGKFAPSTAPMLRRAA